MKICLVSQEYPPETGGGGIGTQTYLKAHGLSARGHEVHVVSTTWEGPARTYQDKLATVHRIAYPQEAQPKNELSTSWLAYSAAVAAKLHELTERIAFDIYQFPEYGAEGFIYQTDTFAQPNRGRYVVQMHGPLGMFVQHMGWPEKESVLAEVGCFMEKMVIRHADGLMSSSYCTAAFCAGAYGAPPEKVRVIHSAINTERFSPAVGGSEAGSGGGGGFRGGPRILFVGNLAGNKGLTTLIDAVLNLRARYPHIHLRAIGKGEKGYVDNLRGKIRDARGEDHIDLKGHVAYDDLPQQYAWCDFFAGPSTYEPGPGNVYLEAMSCGRPVIACNTGGAPEVVLNHRTGLLVPPRDRAALEDAIAQLADDPAERARLSRNGREWIEANFALEKYVDKVEGLYRELASCPRK